MSIGIPIIWFVLALGIWIRGDSIGPHSLEILPKLDDKWDQNNRCNEKDSPDGRDDEEWHARVDGWTF